MNDTEANRVLPRYELNDPLARRSLPKGGQDENRKLAWVNSICFLFLLIGVLGDRRGHMVIRAVQPIEEVIPTVVEPIILPPQEQVEKKAADPKEQTDQQPAAVVVALPSPEIHFAVPAIGTLVVPAALAVAPPLRPMETTATIGTIGSTGKTGDRPQPPYPKIALDEGEQGTVHLTLNGDTAGNVVSVEIKESSGFPILDRATVYFVRRHWRLPAGSDHGIFEASITYQLQLN